MEWFSYVIAIGIGLSAVFSPWLVTRENNKHQLKLKQIENYELAKRQALSNYISASYNHISSKTPENEAKFYIALNNLYIYFSDINNIKYEDLSSAERYSNAENYSYYSQELMKNLSKQILKL